MVTDHSKKEYMECGEEDIIDHFKIEAVSNDEIITKYIKEEPFSAKEEIITDYNNKEFISNNQENLTIHNNELFMSNDEDNITDHDYKEFLSNNEESIIDHNKKDHELNEEENMEDENKLQPESDGEEKFDCVLCGETFSTYSDLESHVTMVHEAKKSATDANQKTPSSSFPRRYHTSFGDDQSTCVPCTVCRKPFATNSNLRKHLINVHKAKLTPSKVFSKVCPLCLFSSNSSNKIKMHRHFEEKHNISLKWERHVFKSFEEFQIWKTDMEAKTVASYIKHSTVKSSGITYHCHRSGSYKRNSKDMKPPKMLGSCKINAFCPSEIKVYVKNSCVEVYHLPTHIGHSNELNHLPLSVKDKKAVIAKLSESDACHDDILSSFNKSVTDPGDLKRINLLRKHDIHNITTRSGLKKESVKKPPEPISVQSFVKGVAHSDEIKLIVCKALGVYSDIYPNLKGDDFLLIYMSKSQNRILMKHCEGTVCVDYTTGKNFHLFTLAVLNDNDEGIPVAFMFTNKVEGSTLLTFFEEIKRVCGTISCKEFMSDLGEMIYSAWLSVMGAPKERIFSTWHVLEYWRKHLDSKVENREKREIIFNSLQSLICEVNEDAFLKMLNTILTKDEELRLFVEFFSREFVVTRPYKVWAHSYGRNADLNKNMSLENFNRAVRFSYMKGWKRQQSVEEAVITSLKQIMDKEFFMIFDMRLETLKQKRNSVRCRHKKSLNMDIQNVKELGDMWKVFYSKKGDFYIVMRRGTCADCRLKCFHCKTCCHEYMCSCAAYAIEKDMCEHVHLVVQSSSVSGGQSVVDTVEIIANGDAALPEDMDVDDNSQTDQNVMRLYYDEGADSACQIEIIVDGDTNLESGILNQNSYTLVEAQGVDGLDGAQFEEGQVLYLVDGDHVNGPEVDPVLNLQEQKSKLVTEFQQFLDNRITEIKQLDVVRSGLTRIMTRKKWTPTRRRPVKVNFEFLLLVHLTYTKSISP